MGKISQPWGLLNITSLMSKYSKNLRIHEMDVTVYQHISIWESNVNDSILPQEIMCQSKTKFVFLTFSKN